MLSSTHFAVGAATAMTVCHPKSFTETLLVGAVGGVIGIWPDCDLENSKISKATNQLSLVIFGLLSLSFLVVRENINILNLGRLFKFFLGLGLFIGLTFFGRTRPHREFTHSLLCCGILCVIFYWVMPDLCKAVVSGALSHLAIDCLNRKKVRLFFPLQFGIKLDLCSSTGLGNRMLGVAAGAYCVIFVILNMIIR